MAPYRTAAKLYRVRKEEVGFSEYEIASVTEEGVDFATHARRGDEEADGARPTSSPRWCSMKERTPVRSRPLDGWGSK
jgi:hypothetical protein